MSDGVWLEVGEYSLPQQAAREDDLVLLAPPATAPEVLLTLLPRYSHERRVRMVGRGVTALAPQVSHLSNVVLTELDAYLPSDRAPMAEPFVATFRDWLGELFPAQRRKWAIDTLFASGMSRFAFAWLQAWLLTRGLLQRHPKARIVCSDALWRGRHALGAEQRAPTISTLRPKAAAALALAVAKRVREQPYIAGYATRRGSAVKHWLALVANDAAPSRHLLAALEPAFLAAGLPYGTLFFGALSATAPARPGGAVAAAQVAALPSPLGLTRVIAEATPLSVDATERLQRVGPFAHAGSSFSLRGESERAVLAWLTMDVLRSLESEACVANLATQQDLRGAQVYFPHASLAAATATDQALQAHGATTIEVVHGSLADPIDMLTHARSASTEKIFWTDFEAQLHGRYTTHQRVRTMYLRASAEREQPAVSGALRILVLSNYAHPGLGFDGRGPRRAYQDALWRLIGQWRHTLAVHQIRWRPHPGDDHELVDATWRDLTEVETSTGSLHDDLAWAHVVLVSVSSTLVEAAAEHQAEVFVHDIPVHERDSVMQAIPLQRRFASATQLRQQVAAWQACLPSVEANQELRARLWQGRIPAVQV